MNFLKYAFILHSWKQTGLTRRKSTVKYRKCWHLKHHKYYLNWHNHIFNILNLKRRFIIEKFMYINAGRFFKAITTDFFIFMKINWSKFYWTPVISKTLAKNTPVAYLYHKWAKQTTKQNRPTSWPVSFQYI